MKQHHEGGLGAPVMTQEGPPGWLLATGIILQMLPNKSSDIGPGSSPLVFESFSGIPCVRHRTYRVAPLMREHLGAFETPQGYSGKPFKGTEA